MEFDDDVFAAATVLNLVKRRLELKKGLVDDVYCGRSRGSAAAGCNVEHIMPCWTNYEEVMQRATEAFFVWIRHLSTCCYRRLHH